MVSGRDSSQIIRCNCKARLFLNLQNKMVSGRISNFDFTKETRFRYTVCLFVSNDSHIFVFIVKQLVFVKKMQMNYGFHFGMQSDVLNNR